jgi:hypothetical protein
MSKKRYYRLRRNVYYVNNVKNFFLSLYDPGHKVILQIGSVSDGSEIHR